MWADVRSRGPADLRPEKRAAGAPATGDRGGARGRCSFDDHIAVTGVNSGGFIVLTALFAMGFGTLWAAMQKPGWKRSPLSLGIVASAAFIVGAVLPVAVLIGLVIAMGIRC